MSQPIFAPSSFPLNSQVSLQQYPSELNIATCTTFGILEDINAYYLLCDDFGYLIGHNSSILTLNHPQITAIQISKVSPNTLKDGYTHMLYVATNDIVYYYAYKYLHNHSLLIHQLALPSPILSMIIMDEQCIALAKDHHLYKIGYHKSEGLLYRQFYINCISQSVLVQFMPSVFINLSASMFPVQSSSSICALSQYFIVHRNSSLELWDSNLLYSINTNSMSILNNDEIVQIVPGANQFACVSKQGNIIYFDLMGSNYSLNDVNYSHFKLIHVEKSIINQDTVISAHGTIDSIFITTSAYRSWNIQRIELQHPRKWITHSYLLDSIITDAKLVIQNEPEICYQYACNATHINSTELLEYSKYLLKTKEGFQYKEQLLSHKPQQPQGTLNMASDQTPIVSTSLFNPPLVYMCCSMDCIYYYTIPNIQEYLLNHFLNVSPSSVTLDFPIDYTTCYANVLAMSFHIPLFKQGNEASKRWVLNRITNKSLVLKHLYQMCMTPLTGNTVWSLINNSYVVVTPDDTRNSIISSLHILQRISQVHFNDPFIDVVNMTLESLYFIKYIEGIQFPSTIPLNIVTWDSLINREFGFIPLLFPIMVHYNIINVLRQHCPTIMNNDHVEILKAEELISNKQYALALGYFTRQNMQHVAIKGFLTRFVTDGALIEGIQLVLIYGKEFELIFEILDKLLVNEGIIGNTGNGASTTSNGQIQSTSIHDVMLLLVGHDDKLFQFQFNDYLYRNRQISLLLKNNNKHTVDWFKSHIEQNSEAVQLQVIYAKYLNALHDYENASNAYLNIATTKG